jgi:hypothetical protein
MELNRRRAFAQEFAGQFDLIDGDVERNHRIEHSYQLRRHPSSTATDLHAGPWNATVMIPMIQNVSKIGCAEGQKLIRRPR